MDEYQYLNTLANQEDSIDLMLAKNEGEQIEESENDRHAVFRRKSEVRARKEKEERVVKKTEKRSGKWSEEEKKTYWLGLMAMIEENPWVKHSWEYWKVDKCFKKMEGLFKGSKSISQIKSYDQRMKIYYYKAKSSIDL
jgi:hypothetical protein